MKNKKTNNNFSIFGINNSISVLLSRKVKIKSIVLQINGLAFKNSDIKKISKILNISVLS